ncbi:MAG: hypothetical protein KIH62_002890 [Candidatus Kerfeldbacteria bacterium]|nr:hypothetical protein [Candidatus Kerfeldbacteria bacterium]
MYIELLENLGLSPNEAKIYEALLYRGESSVGEVSTRAKVHRRNVYDALQRLTEKGLVFPIFQKGENRYQAVSPDKLMEIVREKERMLNAAMPKLRDVYESEPQENLAFVYKGIEGYKNYRRDLLRVSQDTYFLGAKGLWLSPQIDNAFRKQFVLPFQKNTKIKHLTLFDPRVPEKLPQALEDVKVGSYKVLPEKYATPAVCDIFGDYVVTFTSVDIGQLDDDLTIFVMKNPELAQSYRTWFEFMWDALPKA